MPPNGTDIGRCLIDPYSEPRVWYRKDGAFGHSFADRKWMWSVIADINDQRQQWPRGPTIEKGSSWINRTGAGVGKRRIYCYSGQMAGEWVGLRNWIHVRIIDKFRRNEDHLTTIPSKGRYDLLGPRQSNRFLSDRSTTFTLGTTVTEVSERISWLTEKEVVSWEVVEI